jgi:biopolymer transport protein ExbD
MKFPRTAKILRSHFDVAPFAAVFFLLLIFLMLGGLLPIAGLPLNALQPPVMGGLPGPDGPVIAMAVDAQTNFYFENQMVTERVLVTELMVATNTIRAPLTLVIHADQGVTYSTMVHLSALARDHGITNILLATLPPVEAPSPKP